MGFFSKNKVEKQTKINTVYSNENYTTPLASQQSQPGRGVQVYYMSNLSGVQGRDKDGNYLGTRVQQPLFYLTVNERNEIFRLSSPVLGVVTSRMNRISALNYHIMPIKEVEDQVAEELKSQRDLYNEYGDMASYTDMFVRSKVVNELRGTLPDLKPDMSNFDNSLLRWKKRLNRQQQSKTQEIEDWLQEPNTGVSWSEFVKKWVYDMHVHGAAAIYKQNTEGRLTNFDCLIGGTVYKVKNPYFSSMEAYFQVVPGFESQVFFSDEISYAMYIPTSTKSFGLIPLEALINKIAESMLFDKKMANEADDTRMPEKAVVVTDNNNPLGDFDKENDGLPIDDIEQKRMEEKMNTPIQGGMITLSGNSATVVDLTRADTLSVRNERQKDIREECALVYNMSNMEINLTGSGETGGRSTSESQAEIEAGKGVAPHVKTLEEKITRDAVNSRYGYGWKLEIERQRNEKEEQELLLLKLQTGDLTRNELRESKNKSVFVGEEFDKPMDSEGAGTPQPGASERNPVFNRML